MIRNIQNITEKEQVIENEILAFGKAPESVKKYAEYINKDNTFGLFTCEGDLKASLSIYPKRLYCGGMLIDVLGVGHVATKPEFRNEGNMKRLLHYVLEYGYENYDVCLLYPYKYQIYNGTGFRVCEYRHKMEINLSMLGGTGNEGKLIRCKKSDENIINELHKKYIHFLGAGEVSGYLAIDEKHNGRQFSYIWVNIKDEIKSYIECDIDSEKNINVARFYFYDKEGVSGTLGALRVFGGRYNKLIWEIPDGINVNGCTIKIEEVLIKTGIKTLIRIINLENILSKITYGGRDLYIEVSDQVIAQNNGIYLFSSRGNKKVNDRPEQIDYCMDISELTSIVFETNKGLNYEYRALANELFIKVFCENYF